MRRKQAGLAALIVHRVRLRVRLRTPNLSQRPFQWRPVLPLRCLSISFHRPGMWQCHSAPVSLGQKANIFTLIWVSEVPNGNTSKVRKGEIKSAPTESVSSGESPSAARDVRNELIGSARRPFFLVALRFLWLRLDAQLGASLFIRIPGEALCLVKWRDAA